MILRLAPVVLLPEGLAYAWLGGNQDSGPSAVDTGLPGPLGARHPTGSIDVCRRLTVVPDVATVVLCVPIRRAFGETAGDVEPVGHDRAANAVDQLRPARDRHDV